jgi:hypothetical protein
VQWAAAGGGAWPIITLVPPVAAQFTQTNPGTSTYANAANYMFIRAQIGTGDNIRMNIKSIPAPGGTGISRVTAGFMVQSFGNYNRVGVCLRESATAKILTINQIAANFQIDRYNNPTSFVSTPTTISNSPVSTGIMWIRVIYNPSGNSIAVNIGPDGVNYWQYYSETKTSSFTTAPDQWGFHVDSNNSLFPGMISVVHWLEESL